MTKQVQEDIFSMFGIVDEVAEQKEEERKRKAEELRKKIEASSTKTNKKKEETSSFDINENTIIRYYGESIEIQCYISADELARRNDKEVEVKIDGELLRKRMERDYPELVKDMTEMVFIKQKNIVVPTMKAKKKGNCMETSSTEDVSSFKIPFSIFRDFVSVAKFFAENKLEVHADVYWNHEQKKFILDFPEQEVEKYWVEVTESASSIIERVGEDSTKVLEIHSHHVMAPFPSIQDNSSERVPGMMYAIVGFIQKIFPEITIRKFNGSGWDELSFYSVFEDPFYNLPTSFSMDKIEVARYE